MAAGSDHHGGGGGRVRCYYELLEVERQASDDELKKAYRRLALRWHPDKNPDRVEEATSQFRLVQKAYETLSDPQERAWYDKHRERILKGGLGRGDSYREERLDVFQYFTSSCYDDYDDEPEGFYTVYAGVFKDLAEEEIRACDGDDSPPPDFPEFGRSDSDYDAVAGPFYAHWETFFTRKSYVWVEQHDTREAPNKYVRKAMEKENRAAREAARRERNEEVRTLVAFVKKRDPRVRAHRRQLEARAREVEEKARAMAAAARRAHQATVSSYQAPDWARVGDLEAELARLEMAHGAGDSDVSSSDDEADDDDDDDDGDNDSDGRGRVDGDDDNDKDDVDEAADPLSGLLVCRACEKIFRTPGAKLSHDRSKRHRDRVDRLRAQLQRQDEAVAAAAAADGRGAEEVDGVADATTSDDDAATASSSLSSQKAQKKKDRKRSKKNRNKDPLLLLEEEKKQQQQQPEKQQAQAPSLNNAQEASNPDDGVTADNGEDSDAPAAAAAAAASEASSSRKPRRRKDRQRQKQQELLEQRREEAADDDNGGGTTQVCKICRQWFDSKNLLFKHLKESGHAATKPPGQQQQQQQQRTATGAEGRKAGKRK